jgi:hypothetical protein
VAYFLIVCFRFQPRYFGFAFVASLLEAETASSWNFKSVGAQLSARLLFSAQILAIERKLGSRLSSVFS